MKRASVNSNAEFIEMKQMSDNYLCAEIFACIQMPMRNFVYA